MRLFLLLFVLTLGAVSAQNEQELVLQQATCPEFWFNFSNRCYRYIATTKNWADAELHCVSQGANLVSIHSLEEHKFVSTLIRSFDPAQRQTWIGLSDLHKDRSWMWSDGSSVSYEIWSDGDPNNFQGREPCVHTNWGEGKKWNDFPCHNEIASVCKLRAPAGCTE